MCDVFFFVSNDTLTFWSVVISAFSVLVATGAVGITMWIFDEARKDGRIDGFVTRYITLRRDPNSSSDPHGFTVMLDAGALWLRSDEELREAILRIRSSRTPQPFRDDQLAGGMLDLLRRALEMKEDLGNYESIVAVRAALERPAPQSNRKDDRSDCRKPESGDSRVMFPQQICVSVSGHNPPSVNSNGPSRINRTESRR